MIDEKIIQKSFKTAAEKSGLSLSEIAHRSGISVQLLKKYLMGKSVPNVLDFANLCKLFDLDTNVLLGLKDINVNKTY